MECFWVLEADDSKRLDIVLASHEKIASRSEAQRIIKSGSLSINGSSEKISPKRSVSAGDRIEFTIPEPPPSDLVAVEKQLNIEFEDDHLIIVNKPSGMVVHPAAGHHTDTLVNYLLHHTHLPENDPTRPGIVHRIDKDTSGLLVIAKDPYTHEHLANQFFDHSIERTYQAIVWGIPAQPTGTVDQPLGRHPSHRKKYTIRPNGKRAVTHWKLLQKLIYLSLIECRLETGRTHQIRVHLSSIGHSLLGDTLYGRYRNYEKKLSSNTVNLLKRYKGQALHAKSLGFIHPASNNWVRFDSEIPDEMKAIITAMENEQS